MQILGFVILGIIFCVFFGLTVMASGWLRATIIWVAAIVMVGLLALGLSLALG